jgi:CBS domain containing-hemolysin-like protein
MIAAADVVLIALSFLASAFFAGLEIGIVSCDRIRLRYLSEAGSRSARLLLAQLAHPDRLVALTLVGTNLSSVLASALVTRASLSAWGEQGTAIAIPIFILLVMLFAEIFPKALFRLHADALVLASAYPLAAARWALGPAAALFHHVSLLLVRLFPGGGDEARPRLTREELAHFFDRSAHAGGAGRRWFRAVLGLSERTVESALVPIDELPAVSERETIERAALALSEWAGSFLLVREDATGRPLGTVGVHDLLDEPGHAPVAPLVRPAPAVPASRRIEEILPEIQAGKTPIVFVSNAAGDVVGIVTHESIAFGIVGAIEEAPAAPAPRAAPAARLTPRAPRR